MSGSCEVKTQVQVKSSFAGVRSLPSMKSSAFSHVHCLIPSLYMFVYIYIYVCIIVDSLMQILKTLTVYNTLQRIGKNMASSYAFFLFCLGLVTSDLSHFIHQSLTKAKKLRLFIKCFPIQLAIRIICWGEPEVYLKHWGND